MLEAVNYHKLISELQEQHGDAEEMPVALLIGSADSSFMKEHILSRINDYHHGSNYHINFYFPGYGAYWHGHCGPQTVVCTVDGVDWLYSSILFNDFIVHLESVTKWEYSGEVELLIVNYKNGALDFSEVLIFWLDRMVIEGVITSPANLFYRIFRKFKEANSIHSLSDRFTIKSIGEGVLNEIFNTVPLTKELIKGRHYCTRDISV